MARVTGKVAFITGAARGQGRSHAVRLAEEGADIIAVDVCRQVETVPYPMATPDDLAETVRQVEALDRRIVAVEADVRDRAALTRAVEDGVAALGRLDIVLANAGIFVPAATFDMDDITWQTTMDVNLTGVFNTIRAGVPHLVAGGRGGSVVITSSLAALRPNLNTIHYAASKAALVSMMEILAVELGPQNIRVNSLHPTTVLTDMMLNESMYRLFRPDLPHPGRADLEQVTGLSNKLPVPGLESVDVSNAVLHLVSDEGRYITGTTQVLDAGGRL